VQVVRGVAGNMLNNDTECVAIPVPVQVSAFGKALAEKISAKYIPAALLSANFPLNDERDEEFHTPCTELQFVPPNSSCFL
jgi:hypothetical protein